MLSPIFLLRRDVKGDTLARLDHAEKIIAERRKTLPIETASITDDVEKSWNAERAVSLAPGTRILELTCNSLGVPFNKGAGDSAKIAQYLSQDKIGYQIRSFLEEIAQ
jgi:hypothetical protein